MACGDSDLPECTLDNSCQQQPPEQNPDTSTEDVDRPIFEIDASHSDTGANEIDLGQSDTSLDSSIPGINLDSSVPDDILDAGLLDTSSDLTAQVIVPSCIDRQKFFEQQILNDVFVKTRQNTKNCASPVCHAIPAQNATFVYNQENVQNALTSVELKALQTDAHSGLPLLLAKPAGLATFHSGGQLIPTDDRDFQTLKAFIQSTQDCVQTNCATRRADFESKIMPILTKRGSCAGCHTGSININNLFNFNPTNADLTQSHVIDSAMAIVETQALTHDTFSGLPALVARPTGQASTHGGGNLVSLGTLSTQDVHELQKFATSTAICTEAPTCDNRLKFFEDNIYKNIFNNSCTTCHGPASTNPSQTQINARNTRFKFDDLYSALDAAEIVATTTVEVSNTQLSQLLAKPSQQAPSGHPGGILLPVNSSSYNLLKIFVDSITRCTPCNRRLELFEQDIYSTNGIYTSTSTSACTNEGCHALTSNNSTFVLPANNANTALMVTDIRSLVDHIGPNNNTTPLILAKPSGLVTHGGDVRPGFENIMAQNYQTINNFVSLTKQCINNTCGVDRLNFFEQEILADVFSDCIGCHGLHSNNEPSAAAVFLIDPANVTATLQATESKINRIDTATGQPLLVAKPTSQSNHGGGDRTVVGLTPPRLAKLRTFITDTAVCCRNGFAQFKALVNPILTSNSNSGTCISCHSMDSNRIFRLTTDDITANFNTTVDFATQTVVIDGTQVPILLAQTSNQTRTHGLQVYPVGSSQYRILEAFTQTAASCSAR